MTDKQKELLGEYPTLPAAMREALLSAERESVECSRAEMETENEVRQRQDYANAWGSDCFTEISERLNAMIEFELHGL